MEKKFALIYNFAQHYRKSIFQKLDKELDIDFYFGDFLDWAPDVKKMDVGELKGFKRELANLRILKIFIWQKGALSSVVKNKYTNVILYGDPFYLSNFFILMYCRMFKIKTAIWTHGLYKNEKSIFNSYNKLFFNLSDKILLYGNFAKQRMIEKGFKEEKLEVIYNSLDYDNQIRIREQLRESNVFSSFFKNNKPVFIYIGRIQKVKKIEQIVSALEILKDTEFEFNFVVIGDDKENVNLQAMIESKKLESNFWMYGSSYDELEIGNLIYNSIGCISPGNIGLTAMHSLVYGAPAITHNNFVNQMPEFEAIEEGVTGDFYKEDDIDDLVRVIKKWITIQESQRMTVRLKCFTRIDNCYHPNYQISIFKNL